LFLFNPLTALDEYIRPKTIAPRAVKIWKKPTACFR